MKKAYAKTGRVCRVTFAVQPEEHVQSIAVCGEFNGWNPMAHHMKRQEGRPLYRNALAASGAVVSLPLPLGWRVLGE